MIRDELLAVVDKIAGLLADLPGDLNQHSHLLPALLWHLRAGEHLAREMSRQFRHPTLVNSELHTHGTQEDPGATGDGGSHAAG